MQMLGSLWRGQKLRLKGAVREKVLVVCGRPRVARWHHPLLTVLSSGLPGKRAARSPGLSGCCWGGSSSCRRSSCGWSCFGAPTGSDRLLSWRRRSSPTCSWWTASGGIPATWRNPFFRRSPESHVGSGLGLWSVRKKNQQLWQNQNLSEARNAAGPTCEAVSPPETRLVPLDLQTPAPGVTVCSYRD